MNDIVWEDPPNNRVSATMFGEALREVKERPGEWARLHVYDTQSPAYRARRGLVAGNEERWEFKVAGLNNGTKRFGLYARYRTDEQMEEP